jgi:aminoglycoside phosphotransferase (APT) family kinase protein
MSNASSETKPLKQHIGVSTSRDMEATKRALGEWLTPRIADATAVKIVSMAKPTTNGGSSETYITELDVRTARGTRHEQYVLRLKPNEFRIFLRENFAEQQRLITFLADETDVPAPRIAFYEPDASVLGDPFWLMEKIDGLVPPDQPPFSVAGFVLEATPKQRRKIWLSGLEAATRLAKVDIERMPQIVERRPGESGMEENLRHWTAAMHWACAGKHQPALAAAIDWLWANIPERKETGLSHGDCRIGNMIFRDFACVAVLDYDTVTLAGPQLDLAHWLVMDEYFADGLGTPRLPGIGDRQETIAQWEVFMGRPADQLGWHEVLASFRLAINEIRGMSLLPPETQAALCFDDGEAVLTHQLRRILARAAAA